MKILSKKCFNFNYSDLKPIYCFSHREDGMEELINKNVEGDLVLILLERKNG